MHYKVTRLILTPTAGKPSTTAEVFISNPQIDQEAILGKLFLLCEIESTKPQALKIINFLINTLPTNYYQSEKLSIKEKMGTIKVNEIFENALAKTNTEFEKFLKNEKIKIQAKSINIITGIIYKNNLMYTAGGKIKALLIYPEKKEQDDTDKKIYKITSINEQDENKTSLTKIFSNITEGKIPSEGYFIFTNEILPEYINNKHLTKIITTLPPVSAIEQIKTQLHKINGYVTFLALIIKSSTTPEVKRTIPKMQVNVTSSNSLERMQETESETQKYLSATGVASSWKIINYSKNLFNKIWRKKPNLLSNSTIRDKILFSRKSHFRFVTKFNYHLKNFFIYVTNVLVYVFKILSNPRELWQNLKNLYQNIVIYVLKTIRWFFNLSVMSKVWLGTFIICSILFGYSLFHVSYTKKQQVSQTNYQEIVQLITQKQNQIEASFIYHNEEKAAELVEETTILIKELATYKNVDEKLVNNFSQINQGHTEKISHVIVINNTDELANFSNLNSSSNINSIINLDNQIFASDINNNSIYRLNLGDNTIHVMTENKNNINFADAITEEEVLFVANNGGLTINKKNEIDEFTNNIMDGINQITDIAIYNGRLYVLSASKNNIYRYARNFTSPQTWIKESIDINNAKSLDIDGYVYILQNNGEIIKMLSGYTNELKLASVSPVLSDATKLKLTGDSESGYIYILEPSKNRLVVFDKAGRFHVQYKFEKLSNIKDFLILEEEKKILILNDNSVYEVEAQHLN